MTFPVRRGLFPRTAAPLLGVELHACEFSGGGEGAEHADGRAVEGGAFAADLAVGQAVAVFGGVPDCLEDLLFVPASPLAEPGGI